MSAATGLPAGRREAESGVLVRLEQSAFARFVERLDQLGSGTRRRVGLVVGDDQITASPEEEEERQHVREGSLSEQ